MNPSRLHILHCVLSMDIGGLERMVLSLSGAGIHAGHRVSILCLERAGALGPLVRDMGGSLIELNKAPGLTPGLVKEIRRVLRQDPPDVVHTHQIGALLYAGKAARYERVPVVHTEHSNHIGMRVTRIGRMKMRLLWWFASGFTDRFCCVSKDILAAAGRIVRAKKLRFVPNGIPLSDFGGREHRRGVRESLGIADEAKVVGVVARLSKEKSLDLLIRGFAQLRKDRHDVYLLLVGDGPCRSELSDLVTELQLDTHVHFAGFQSEPQRFMQSMDIFCLTSRMEGMPLVILEAWAQGLPVVASAVGGLPDLICDGETGLLFTYGDPSALANQLARLLDDPALSERLGLAGRARVEADFSIDRMARSYQSQYSETLTKRCNLNPASVSSLETVSTAG